MTRSYTYLALGDSYTIGESLPLAQSFPYQVAQSLRKKGFNCCAPEIIAKTGWTTDELWEAMDGYTFLPKYDFITLLIGVNNQYRGRTVEEYKAEFEKILERAITLSDKKSGVIVLSIPDYSVTPFGKDHEPESTAKELEIFNSVIKALSVQYKVQYADVTESSKEAAMDRDLLAADQLHPSAGLYAIWTKSVVQLIENQMK